MLTKYIYLMFHKYCNVFNITLWWIPSQYIYWQTCDSPNSFLEFASCFYDRRKLHTCTLKHVTLLVARRTGTFLKIVVFTVFSKTGSCKNVLRIWKLCRSRPSIFHIFLIALKKMSALMNIFILFLRGSLRVLKEFYKWVGSVWPRKRTSFTLQ